ncbi:hypothetical protein GQ457_05G008580 [Hibiscus cannabinus]
MAARKPHARQSAQYCCMLGLFILSLRYDFMHMRRPFEDNLALDRMKTRKTAVPDAIPIKVDKVRFRKPVVAGDTLVMRMTLIKLQKRFGIAKMEGKAYVGGDLVCEDGERTVLIRRKG